MINHYIEAEDLKTGAILYIIWLAGAEQMVDMWLCEAEGLNDDLIDLLLNSHLGDGAVICC